MKPNSENFEENFVYNALRTKIGKVIEISYVIGEGPNTNTGKFLLESLDRKQAMVRKTAWNEQGKRVPVGNTFSIPLDVIISFPHGGTRANFEEDSEKQ
ncbi:MAG: hypothetical protein QW597_04680 [Thermoplasmataceae archaeon]